MKMKMKSTQSRTWDIHFATDVLEEKLPLDPLDILAVGGRGRSCRLNIPENLLTIPTTPFLLPAEAPTKQGKGRGKRLIKNHGVNLSNINLSDESIQEFSHRINKQKLQDDTEWPSLSRPSKILTGSSSTQSITVTTATNSGTPFVPTDEKVLVESDKKNINYGCEILMEGQFSDCWEDLVVRHSDEREKICPVNNMPNEDKLKSSPPHQYFKFNLGNNGNKQVSEKLLQDLDLNFDSMEENTLPSDETICTENVKREPEYTDKIFLSQLEDKECYVLIENIPINANEEEFQELIQTFGTISVFLVQPSITEEVKTALVKMENSSQCDWVISCLDGSFHDDSNERLVVRRVEDIFESKENT